MHMRPFKIKCLVKTVTAFTREVSLEVPTVVLIEIKRAFSGDGEKIRLPVTEVLLCANDGDLEKSYKLCNWTSRNAILLPPFLTEAVVTD